MYHLKLELGQMVACIMSSVNKTFFFSKVIDETKFGLNYKISLIENKNKKNKVDHSQVKIILPGFNRQVLPGFYQVLTKLPSNIHINQNINPYQPNTQFCLTLSLQGFKNEHSCRGGVDCTSYQYNSEFYLENRKIFFCINVNKNAKEKLSSGFGVTKIKTDTTRACFPNSWCNQPPPLQRQG